VPQRVIGGGRRKIAVATPQRVTVEYLRRSTDACRDLNDPLLMAAAWDAHDEPEPPKWSAPAGWPDERLDALKAGEVVRMGSSELLCAFIAADMPRSSYARWCYGGRRVAEKLRFG
jgi:hypothetical protein